MIAGTATTSPKGGFEEIVSKSRQCNRFIALHAALLNAGQSESAASMMVQVITGMQEITTIEAQMLALNRQRVGNGDGLTASGNG